MPMKQEQHTIMGMQRDLTVSKFNPQFAYENMNIRITARENSTLLSVSNEKGTSIVEVTKIVKPNKITVEPNGNITSEFPVESIVKGYLRTVDTAGNEYNHIVILGKGESSNSTYKDNIPEGQSIKGFYFDSEEAVYDNTYQYYSDASPLKFVPGGSIEGIALGYCIINKYIVLFTKDNDTNTDYIYRLESEEDHLIGVILFKGELDFSTDYPIQTLGSYENDNIQKVYWVDGLNQPRLVNIMNESYTNKEQFNFLREITNDETILVNKVYGTGGFPSGVIQYAFSYYIRNGQESTIIYSTPLYYISPKDRGGSPEELVECAFKITIANASQVFDGINIYSITRTSLDATPSVKLVAQIPVTNGTGLVLDTDKVLTVYRDVQLHYNSIDDIIVYDEGKLHNLSEYEYKTDIDDNRVYTISFKNFGGIFNSNDINKDNQVTLYQANSLRITLGSTEGTISTGTEDNINLYPKCIYSNASVIEYTDIGSGETVDPTELLYKGGEEIIPYTIAQKDNTLFLGNLYIKRSAIPEDIRNEIKSSEVFTSLRSDEPPVKVNDLADQFYQYKGYQNLNSGNATTFKWGEEYRLGLVFLHKTGKWSEAVPARDRVMDMKMNITESEEYTFPKFNIRLSNKTIRSLLDLGYIACKPVIVFPSLEERNVLAQGILCPTVFDYSERDDNSVYARSSWYARPKISFNGDELPMSTFARVTPSRVNDTLHNNGYICGEIQNSTPLHAWAVDENVFTFHSPEIEFDTDTHKFVSNSKMRLVGYARCDSNMSDYSITATDRFRTNYTGNMPYKTIQYNYSRDRSITRTMSGHLRLIAAPVWEDGVFGTTERENSEPYMEGKASAVFPVYPWHRDTNLNNDTRGEGGSSVLQRKVFSTLLYTDTRFFDHEYDFEVKDDTYRTGVADLQVFSSNEISAVMLNPPKYSGESQQSIYYGNTDRVVSGSSYSFRYVKDTWINDVRYDWPDQDYMAGYYALTYIPNQDGRPYYKKSTSDPIRIKYKSTPHVVGRFNNSRLYSKISLPRISKYDNYQSSRVNSMPIVSSTIYIENIVSELPSNPVEGGYYCRYYYKDGNIYYGYIYHVEEGVFVNVATNSSISISIDGTTEYINRKDTTLSYRLIKRDGLDSIILMPANAIPKDYKDDITVDYMPSPPPGTTASMGYFLVAELYRENEGVKFGGTTDTAYSNNIWVSAGKTRKLYSDDSELVVSFTEGDTFFQRYDHLKTYPFDGSSKNNLVEIVSFMCETRINIDGRYDRNRGKQNNLSITPQNFNLLNPVYSQKNTYFTYNFQDINSTSVNSFPNTVTWTSEKSSGSLIDAWTNISLASTLDLDGDKGKVVSLNTINNEIFCFQEHGLSNIIFNPRVQIPVSDNLPIEIGNNYKVQGKRYISNMVGCNNKWSICQTPNGLYFIDNYTNALYLFNGQSLDTVSDRLGFRQFIGENNSLEKWDPVNYKNFRTFFDGTNDDVYFINDKYCLCYSELLQQFTSFMSYEKNPMMFNYDGKFYSINKNKVWKVNGGDYNMFFGEFKPYYITIVANQDEPLDKTFNTVEFRADMWNGQEQLGYTFDTLDVYNEYQHGHSDLSFKYGLPSSLKRKFRIWRANVPRANTPINGIKPNNRDRIRNTWAYVKLSKTTEDTNRMNFYDLSVNYFE